MKRCIVCGNIGSDDSVSCDVCGNPFIDLDLDELPDEDGAVPDDGDDMEEQFKEIWNKVLDDEPDTGAGDAESEITDLPDLDDADFPESAEDDLPDLKMPDLPELEETDLSEPESPKVSKSNTAEVTKSEQAELPESEKPVTAGNKGKRTGAGKAASSAAGNSGEQAEDDSVPRQKDTAENSARKSSRTRRSRSGPQIYGQDAMAGYEGAQGVIRRDVQGGHPINNTENTHAETPAAEGQTRPPRRPPHRQPTPSAPQAPQDVPADTSQRRPENVRQRRPMNLQEAPANGAVPRNQNPQSGTQPYVQAPRDGRTPAQSGGKNAGLARRIMETARDAVASPLLILVAIFHTVYFVSSVAAIFLRQLSYGQMAKLLTLFNLPSQLSGYVSMFQSAMSQLDQGALVLNLVIRIPDLLFCLGLWIICITVRSSGEKMSGAGFLLMRIDILLNMLVSCVILLIILIVSVTLVIASWSAGTQGLPVAIVTLVAAIVVTMAILMYYFCYLATIKTVQRNARSGEQYGKVSAYVALIHIILAFTGVINILSGIVNLEITGITGGIGRIAWMILFGIWIFRYRSTLSEYEE
ncbi:MAG: hypothetical protein LUH07_00180 [Lachnospiraceae bacterium]|nr:hypothetical protein [Lachnospiraceae bacterium]